MPKFILAALVIILVGLALYIGVVQKGNSPINLPSSVTRENASTTPEDDLTALDRDLAELESDEASFLEELNNL